MTLIFRGFFDPDLTDRSLAIDIPIGEPEEEDDDEDDADEDEEEDDDDEGNSDGYSE